jgi:hypothetical protein
MLRATLPLSLCLSIACSSPSSGPASPSGGESGGGNAGSAGATSGSGGAGAGSSGASGNGGGGSNNGGSAGAGSGGTSLAGGGSGAGGTSAGTGGGNSTAGASGSGGAPNPLLERFSFFVTSLSSIREVSKSDQGFGGDLRFGEQGDGAGLRGADKICQAIAELGMPGAGAKTWRAFLSATAGGPNGGPVHAKDRIGSGPWYDATGRVVAMSLADLIGADRPIGADPAIRNDLPNEFGIPNHTADAPGCTGNDCPDNHQVLTGTNCLGQLYTGGANVMSTCMNATPPNNAPNPLYTCNDWTSKAPEGEPWCGHSWPRQGSGLSWMSSAKDGGCAPCVRLEETGGVNDDCVGSAGGYGGFYCFELK